MVGADRRLTPAWLHFFNRLDGIARTNVIAANSPAMEAFLEFLETHEARLQSLLDDQAQAAAKLQEIVDLNIVRMELFPLTNTSPFVGEYDLTMCQCLTWETHYLGDGSHSAPTTLTMVEWTKRRLEFTFSGDADWNGGCVAMFGWNITEDGRT
jgi:hypothetical protein